MGVAFVQRIDRRVDDVPRRIEIRLADLEMHNVASLRLERLRFDQHFERRFRPETRHPAGETQVVRLVHEREYNAIERFVVVANRDFCCAALLTRAAGT